LFAAAAAACPQVSGQPFFEMVFLFYRCSINMYLS